MTQKKILIAIDSLQIGGAEKSLVSLLNILDIKQYQIDLQLFKRGGAFEKYLPDGIALLPIPSFNEFLQKGLIHQLLHFNFKYLVSRIRYTFFLHTHNALLHRVIARKFWTLCSKCYGKSLTNYDIAIAYGQGLPTFYVADKVRAAKKLAWVNAEYILTGDDQKYQQEVYKKIDTIVAVSETVHNQLQSVFPEYTDKLAIMPDLINEKLIYQMSQEFIPDIDSSKKYF